MNESIRKRLLLYVYIPFCSSRCLYCDYPTIDVHLKLLRKYTDALCAEVAAVGQDMSEYRVEAIHFAGGTPLLISGTNLAEIIHMIRKCFSVDDDAEITVESIPGKIDAYNFREFDRIGVNRLSMGFVTGNRDEFRRIGRCGEYDTINATNALRKGHGFANLSIDILHGLPGQTMDTWKYSLKRCIDINPAHIVVSPFRFEAKGKLQEICLDYPVPSEEEQYEMYLFARSYFEDAGFHQYSIENFSKEGFEWRYYLNKCAGIDVCGLGIGAISFYDGINYTNTLDLDTYLKSSYDFEKTVCNPLQASPQSILHNYIQGRLSLSDGLSKDSFFKRFGISFDDALSIDINDLFQNENIEIRNDRVSLTAKGMFDSSQVFSAIGNRIGVDK